MLYGVLPKCLIIFYRQIALVPITNVTCKKLLLSGKPNVLIPVLT